MGAVLPCCVDDTNDHPLVNHEKSLLLPENEGILTNISTNTSNTYNPNNVNTFIQHIQPPMQITGSLTPTEQMILSNTPTNDIYSNDNAKNEFIIVYDDDIKTQEEKDIEKRNRLRTRAVEELVSTETTYIVGLLQLIEFYVTPLKNNKKIRKLITSDDHKMIFPSDLTTIYSFHIQLNADLLKLTKNWNNKTSKIGHLFIEFGELFKLYQDYMLKHDKAIQRLIKLQKKNTKFEKWHLEQSQKVNGLTIQSFLILPIQRLPRYEMLLKEIIKRTEAYHIDLYDLQNALDVICEVTELINDKMKEYDKIIKVSLIQKLFIENKNNKNIVITIATPSRLFIDESKELNDIIKHDKFGNQQNIMLFLFNDCLIYGIKINSNSKYLQYGGMLEFDALFEIQSIIYDDNDDDDEGDIVSDVYKQRFSLKIYSKKHSIWISFKDNVIKNRWNDIIIETKKLYQSSIMRVQSFENNENELYLAYPVYIPSDYIDICMDCNNKFSAFKRKKNHCNYCGKLLCNKCLNYKCIDIWKLYFEQKEILIKVCENCKNERKQYLEIHKDDVNDNNLNLDITHLSYHSTVDSNLSTQSTFDMTIDHLKTSSRISKRRNKINDDLQRKTSKDNQLTNNDIQNYDDQTPLMGKD